MFRAPAEGLAVRVRGAAADSPVDWALQTAATRPAGRARRRPGWSERRGRPGGSEQTTRGQREDKDAAAGV